MIDDTDTAYERTSRLRPGTTRGHFSTDLPKDWSQGHTAFGGLVAAWFHHAFDHVVAEPERPLRSMTLQFAAGLQPGPVDLQVHVARQTRSLTHLSAKLSQSGQTAVLATAIAARARDLGAASAAREPEMPQLPPPHGVRPLPVGPLTPTFIQHLDVRFVSRRGLFSNADNAYFAAWVRLVEPSPVDDAQQALISDVLPPAVFATLDRPRPGATTSMTLHFMQPGHTLPAGERVLVESSSEAWADGYSSQDNRVWTADGQLLIRGRQLVAVIK